MLQSAASRTAAFRSAVTAVVIKPTCNRAFNQYFKSRSQPVTGQRKIAAMASADKPVLYHVPVSNNGARALIVLYAKGVEDQVEIRAPAEVGGLKSEEYLKMNPLGKMPLLTLPDGFCIYESQVITNYLIDKFANVSPSFRPSTAESRARGDLAARVLDVYITPIQACMYRAMDLQPRLEALKELARQLDVLETIVAGPHVAGEELSDGDAALYPTFIFMNYMLPQFFGWSSIFTGRPKLEVWWNHVSQNPAFARVRSEMEEALKGWKSSGRWEKVGIIQQVKENPQEQWAP